MAKDYNYGYVFVMYDVDEKRCQKVFKICKKYLTHYQLSVFRGKITPANLIKLKAELKRVINKKEDKVSIIKLLNEHYFDEEMMGVKPEIDERLFL